MFGREPPPPEAVVTEMTEELAAQLGTRELKGMVITRIIADCAADRAGLHVGDILMEVAGVDIHSYAEMMEVLGKCSPGDKVEVVYQRNGQPKTTTVTLLNAMGNTQILRR